MRMLLIFVLLIILIGVVTITTEKHGRIAIGSRSPDTLPDAFRSGRLYQIEAKAALQGWTPELHLQAGDLRAELGDLIGAVTHWRAGQTTDPQRLRILAEAQLTLEQWAGAVDTLEALVAQAPDEAWAHYHLGLLLIAADPARAEPHLTAAGRLANYTPVTRALVAVIRDSDAEEPLSMRVGQAMVRAEMWAYAESAFRYAAAIAHPYPEALAYIALARAHQGKPAAHWIEQALAFGADVPLVHYVNGLHLRERGDYHASLEAFMTAAALDPNNAAYYAELGKAHQYLFNYEQAEHWLRTAVSVSGGEPRFQEMLAVFYAEEGYNLPLTSGDDIRAFADVLPQDPDLIVGMGWALFAMGDAEAALAEFDAALQLAPDHTGALYYKARALAGLGRLDEALPLLRRAASSTALYNMEAALLLEQLTSNQAGASEPLPELTPDP